MSDALPDKLAEETKRTETYARHIMGGLEKHLGLHDFNMKHAVVKKLVYDTVFSARLEVLLENKKCVVEVLKSVNEALGVARTRIEDAKKQAYAEGLREGSLNPQHHPDSN